MSLASIITAVEVRITGRVQSVGFRGWTADHAKELGVSGWIRNDPDGAVVAHFYGLPAPVAEILQRVQRGPETAQVARISIEDVDPPETLQPFEVIR